jgi:hypothetical protein
MPWAMLAPFAPQRRSSKQLRHAKVRSVAAGDVEDARPEHEHYHPECEDAVDEVTILAIGNHRDSGHRLHKPQ